MINKTSAIQPLLEEHRHVLAKLEDLEAIFNSLDRKEENAVKLKELITFFQKTFWVHFDKEEQALFPEFDNFMPHGAGPLAAMIEEHQVLRDTNDVLQEAVAVYLGGGDNENIRRTINESGMHFVEFLRGHIFKEDKLFPQLADMHLGAAQNARVLEVYKKIEGSSNNTNNGLGVESQKTEG